MLNETKDLRFNSIYTQKRNQSIFDNLQVTGEQGRKQT